MSADPARAARAALAAIGTDLRAGEGGPGERRAAALLAAVRGREPPAASLPELIDSPGWLRAPRETQRRIATAAALLSMGPALATSIQVFTCCETPQL